MSRVYVQVVKTMTGGYQHEMIDEQVMEGFEVANALKHLGINSGEVSWNSDFINGKMENNPRLMTGFVEGTDKVVNVVVIQ